MYLLFIMSLILLSP